MKGYIYEYRNIINNKYYVGQTIDLKRRHWQHSQAKDDTYFHHAIQKYGFDKFEYNVVSEYECFDRDELQKTLNSAEEKQIILRNSIRPNGYNILLGGADYCTTLNTTAINNGENIKYVFDDELQDYLDKGWIIGRLPVSDNAKKNMSIKALERFNGENADIEREKTSITTKKGMEIYRENNPDWLDKHKKAMGNPKTRKNLSNSMKNYFDTHTDAKQHLSDLAIERNKDPKYREKQSQSAKKRYELDPTLRKRVGRKGRIPWNKGKKGLQVSHMKGKPANNKGQHRVYHEDGTYHYEK